MPRPSRLSMRVRLGRMVASWFLVAIGVPLLVQAHLGVAPFDVLNTGVAGITGWSFGVVFVVDGLVCFLIGTLLGTPPGPASWIGAMTIGPLIDLSLRVIPQPGAIMARGAMLCGGIVAIAGAICLVVSTDLGAGPTEVIMLGLIRRRVGVVAARVISDGVPLLVGIALGGAIGVGTVVFLVLMGPLVRFGLQRLGHVPIGLVAPAATTAAHRALG